MTFSLNWGTQKAARPRWTLMICSNCCLHSTRSEFTSRSALLVFNTHRPSGVIDGWINAGPVILRHDAISLSGNLKPGNVEDEQFISSCRWLSTHSLKFILNRSPSERVCRTDFFCVFRFRVQFYSLCSPSHRSGGTAVISDTPK